MSIASPNADAYSWIGASGALWGLAANWQDVTSGANPATFSPGALTPASISGPTSATIGGGGASASLTVTGTITLSGAYSTGDLAVGTRTGSGSGSYVYAAGALIVANTVAATTIHLASGSLGLTGAATLAVSGTVTLGAQRVVSGNYDPGAAASLGVAAGSSFAAGAMAITQGAVTVSGAGAVASVAGPVSLGVAGVPPVGTSPYSFNATGTVTIANGGVFAIADALTETAGSVSVSGVGSRLSVQKILTIGLAAGSFSLSATNGGTVQADGLVLQAPASSNTGPASTTSPAIFVDAAGSIEIGSGVAAAGTLTIDAGKSLTATTDATITGAIVDNGLLSEAGGNLILAGNLSGTGVLQIGNNGSVTMNGTVAASDRIVFADAAATLIVGTNPATHAPYVIAATISGFQLGDNFLFATAANSAAYVVTGVNLGTLTLFSASAPIATLTLAGSYTPGAFVLGPTTAGGSSVRLQTASKHLPRSDFNGDGRSDVLWQNDNGIAAIWEMNGTSYIGGGTLSNPGASWHVTGSGDFNGDGKADILWQNDNGTVAIWEMDGASYIGGGVIGNPGASWRVKGSGDFNGDGKADILWQNNDGTVAIWEMNGTSYIGGGTLSSPGASWHVKGSGDFNGDGKADILWQNDNGTVAIWEMDGASYIGGGVVGNPGVSWHVKGAGDFNGDGKADILWQNDNGTVAIWEMNGTSYIGGGTRAVQR